MTPQLLDPMMRVGQDSVLTQVVFSGGRGQVGQVALSVTPDNYDSL